MKPFAFAGLLLLSFVTGADAAEQSTAAGVFTAEQAKKGEQAYQASCAACHGLDLHRIDAEAPDLTDSPFRFGWGGKTIGERFTRTRDTMPKGNPRSLDDQTYVDIIAYILQFNRIPAGQQTLTADPAVLDSITIEVPQASGGTRRRR